MTPAPRPARANPFRSACVERLRYRLDADGWADLLARLEELGYRAALVGGDGTGKTTLLLEVEQRLAAQGWRLRRLRLCRERRRPPAEAWRALFAPADPLALVTVDGAELLSRWRWRHLQRFSRRCGGLLVTSHRRGLLPSLHEHHTTPELLLDLVAELVGPRQSGRLAGELGRLFRAHRGNLRECLWRLYDRWSEGNAAASWRPAG